MSEKLHLLMHYLSPGEDGKRISSGESFFVWIERTWKENLWRKSRFYIFNAVFYFKGCFKTIQEKVEIFFTLLRLFSFLIHREKLANISNPTQPILLLVACQRCKSSKNDQLHISTWFIFLFLDFFHDLLCFKTKLKEKYISWNKSELKW